MSHLGPVLFALVAWWFSTGAIIYLDGLRVSTFKWSMLAATVLAAAGLYGISTSATEASVAGAFQAFGFTLLVWGWIEMSFYMGYVTGVGTTRCPQGCSGWPHFLHALRMNIWHELAIVLGLVAIYALTRGAANQLALWTYLIFWWMHESARINVLLGVRNVNEHFIPDHLDFLKGFLTSRPINLFFPISVSFSTAVFTLLIVAAHGAASGFDQVAMIFLATIMGLAIVEHWFLILPLPFDRLWSWSVTPRHGEPANAHAHAHTHTHDGHRHAQRGGADTHVVLPVVAPLRSVG